MDYTHDLADMTAQKLRKFSFNILKLSAMMPEDCVNLYLEYDKPGEESKAVLIYAYRDEEGSYLLNEVKVGELEEAIEVYSLACATLVKDAAVDEYSADQMEEMLVTLTDAEKTVVPSSVGCDVWKDFHNKKEIKEEIIEIYHMGQDVPADVLSE